MATDIIKSSFSPEEQQSVDEVLQKINRLAKSKRLLIIRHNDTVVTGFVKRAGVIDPYVFTQDSPEKFMESIKTSMEIAKKSGITRLESDKKQNIEALTALGYPVQETKTGWSLDLQ
jgi:uroporphyrinogen-III synthase